jgi:hypothetical protein
MLTTVNFSATFLENSGIITNGPISGSFTFDLPDVGTSAPFGGGLQRSGTGLDPENANIHGSELLRISRRLCNPCFGERLADQVDSVEMQQVEGVEDQPGAAAMGVLQSRRRSWSRPVERNAAQLAIEIGLARRQRAQRGDDHTTVPSHTRNTSGSNGAGRQ